MRNYKKIIAIALVISIVLAFSACGGKGEGSKTKNTAKENVYLIREDDCDVEIGTPDKTVDPQSVYSNLEYNNKMFYGRYCFVNWFKNTGDNEDVEKLRQEMTYVTDPFNPEQKISAVPILMQVGPESNSAGIVHERKYDWVRATFLREDSSTTDYDFKYEVKGDKLILTGVDYDYNNDTKKLKYKILDDIKMEFGFSFAGIELTLTNGDSSIKLYSNYTYSGEEEYLYATSYVNSDSPTIDDIFEISFRWSEDDEPWFNVNYEYEDENGETQTTSAEGALEINKNGLFTFTVPYETGNKTYQFACLLCGDDGVVLADGDNVYYYQTDYFEYTKNDLSNNVDITLIEDMNESELKQIEQKKTDLFDDLADAFRAEGIKVTVNKKTGELAMDTSVLFGGDSAELTKEGKDFLNKFIKAYTEIAFNEKYDGFISKTIVEGHIAPVDGVTYEKGMPLSEKRAKNVKDYCLSKDTGVDTAKLAKALETKGYSNSKPIKDKNGNIDYDASRRVSFRFIINVDKAN